jgi:ribonuclease III
MQPDQRLLRDAESSFGHVFADRALLIEALTHPSYTAENPDSAGNNQRLEFLGDAVIQLVISTELFRLFPEEREGVLSKRRSQLTRGECLAQLARERSLDRYILVSSGERSSDGHLRMAALEDALEAIAGAVYRDSDFAVATRVILGWYGDIAQRLAALPVGDNPKGRLQELFQPEFGNDALAYEVTSVEGPPHQRRFVAEVRLNGERIGSGSGTSKREAEEEAARAALQDRQGTG